MIEKPVYLLTRAGCRPFVRVAGGDCVDCAFGNRHDEDARLCEHNRWPDSAVTEYRGCSANDYHYKPGYTA